MRIELTGRILGELASQVLDYFVASLNHHQSCALMFYPHVAGICTESETDITPFGPGKIVLSVGMILVAVLSIPLGYYNLEDNIMVQNVALVIIIVSTLFEQLRAILPSDLDCCRPIVSLLYHVSWLQCGVSESIVKDMHLGFHILHAGNRSRTGTSGGYVLPRHGRHGPLQLYVALA